MAIKIQGDIVIYDDKVFKVGSGTTAERPDPPAVGMIRYNTDLGLYETYNTSGWTSLGVADVSGPLSSANNELALFNGTTGKLIKSGLGTGSNGQFLISGGSGNVPSWKETRELSGNFTVAFTAANNITAGQVVQYTTGTNVEPIYGSNTVYNQSISSVYSAGSVTNANLAEMATSDDGTKIVAFYNIDGFTSACAIKAGNINTSTGAITWGAAVSIPPTASATHIQKGCVSFYPGSNSEFFVAVADNSSTGNLFGYFGTLSNTTISVTKTTLRTGTHTLRGVSIYAPGKGLILLSNLSAIGFTFSGTTPTVGTLTSLATANAYIQWDRSTINTGEFLVALSTSSSGSYPMSVVKVQANGTTVSAGSLISTGYSADSLVKQSIAYDNNVPGRFFVGIKGSVKAGTIVGANISFGGSVTIPTLSGSRSTTTSSGLVLKTPYLRDTYPPRSILTAVYNDYTPGDGDIPAEYFTNIAIIRWNDDTNSNVGANLFSHFTATQLNTLESVEYVPGSYASLRFAVSYYAGNQTYRAGTYSPPLTYVVSNLDATGTKLAGIAMQSASTGSTVGVDILKGINKTQSGLEPQSIYYVNTDGNLTTSNAAPNVLVGKAITSNVILLKDQTI